MDRKDDSLRAIGKWDGSLYPDEPMPDMDHASRFQKAEYLHRFCTEADFGFVPWSEHVEALADPEWRTIFDEFPIPNSPAYQALRELFDWGPGPVEEDDEVEPPFLEWSRRSDGSDQLFAYPCPRG